MPTITVRLTAEMEALIDEACRHDGFESGEAYLHHLMIEDHTRRANAIEAAIAEHGEGATRDDAIAAARSRYRAMR